jgi:hypothetical protein
MFEDAVGIQIKALMLDAGAANATSLNAIQQSFQAGVSFNSLNLLQNRTKSDLFTAKSDLRPLCLDNGPPLQPQYFSATGKASATQSALDALKVDGNRATQAQIDEAAKTNSDGQATKAALNDQMTAIKNAAGDSSSGPPNFTSSNSSPSVTPAPTTTTNTPELTNSPSVTPSGPSILAIGTMGAGPLLPPTSANGYPVAFVVGSHYASSEHYRSTRQPEEPKAGIFAILFVYESSS